MKYKWINLEVRFSQRAEQRQHLIGVMLKRPYSPVGGQKDTASCQRDGTEAGAIALGTWYVFLGAHVNTEAQIGDISLIESFSDYGEWQEIFVCLWEDRRKQYIWKNKGRSDAPWSSGPRPNPLKWPHRTLSPGSANQEVIFHCAVFGWVNLETDESWALCPKALRTSWLSPLSNFGEMVFNSLYRQELTEGEASCLWSCNPSLGLSTLPSPISLQTVHYPNCRLIV